MVKVIPWISMVFSLLSLARSVPKEDKIGVCYKNVSSIQYRTVTYRQSYINFWGSLKFEMKTRQMSNRVWVPKEVCCPGYVQTSNKSCEAQCSPACVSGYCVKPNICKCNFGWGSDVCNETTVCVVAAETVETSKSLGLEIPENAPENPLIAQHTEYACRPGCLPEVNNSNTNFTRTANTTYHFVSVDSPCNTEDAAMRLSRSKKYGYAIGGTVITIIIVTIVIFVVLKQRRTRTLPTKSAPIPDPFSNYMEENTIYAGTDVVL